MRALAIRAAAIALLLAGLPVAAATIAFSDTFDRPDGSALGNGWQEVAGDLLIQGGELRSAAGIGGASIAVQPGLTGDEQSVAAKLASGGNNSIAVLGFVLRYRDAQNYYALYRLTGGTSVLRISAIANGQEIVLGQTGVPNPSENVFFKLSASARAGTITFTLEGVKTLTVSDTRFAAGSAGMMLGNRTTNAALRVVHRADEFSAAVSTSAPPAPRIGVALASDPAPQAVLAAAEDVTFANLVLDAAGSPEDVAVHSVQLDLEIDTGATSPQYCQLFEGSLALAGAANIVNPAGAGPYTFAFDAALVVTPQAPRTVRVECDVPATATPGDTMEWRLRAGAVVVADSAQSGQPAAVDVQPSANDQNKVTVRADAAGTQTVDLQSLRAVLRTNEIGLGPDLGEQKPPLLPHYAMNFVGASPPTTAWLAVYDGATYGDATVCADMLDSEINGEQCGGVAALFTQGTSGRAIVARSCDAKGTDTLRLGVLDTSSGAVTPLVNTNLYGRIDTYGGTNPPANCDHHQNQLDYHMYCQWIRTCLDVATNGNGTVTFTATSWLRGTGLKNDPSRNDPTSPWLTLIGTATWTGARPTNVAASGKIGLVGTATQANQQLSLTNLTVEANP